MIRTNIKKKKRRILCDFHGADFEFIDFTSFFSFVLGIARDHSIYIIEIIHGKGKDSEGLAFLPDLIDERLKNIDEVIHYDRDPKNMGMVCIHLSACKTVTKCNDNPFRSLRKAVSPHRSQILHRGPSLVIGSAGREQAFDARINDVIGILDTKWCEDSVKCLLKDLKKAKCFDEINYFHRYISQFEVFYSPDFSKWLEIFYSSEL